jgi:transposase
MVEKLTGPDARSAHSVSQETGVAATTLLRWVRQAQERPSGRGRPSVRKRWTPEEKYRVVMAAQAAGQEGLGSLLRREGLHEADVARFGEEVHQAAMEQLKRAKKRRGLSPEQKRIAELERELRRKDKALAEAAALLVLRKKSEAFFLSEDEGDDIRPKSDK